MDYPAILPNYFISCTGVLCRKIVLSLIQCRVIPADAFHFVYTSWDFANIMVFKI